MSRTRGHNGRPSIRMPAVLRVACKSNVWSDWPYCGPSPGRGLRPFVRAAKHAENQRVLKEIAQESGA
jgi:hypothetical protein